MKHLGGIKLFQTLIKRTIKKYIANLCGVNNVAHVVGCESALVEHGKRKPFIGLYFRKVIAVCGICGQRVQSVFPLSYQVVAHGIFKLLANSVFYAI